MIGNRFFLVRHVFIGDCPRGQHHAEATGEFIGLRPILGVGDKIHDLLCGARNSVNERHHLFGGEGTLRFGRGPDADSNSVLAHANVGIRISRVINHFHDGFVIRADNRNHTLRIVNKGDQFVDVRCAALVGNT